MRFIGFNNFANNNSLRLKIKNSVMKKQCSEALSYSFISQIVS